MRSLRQKYMHPYRSWEALFLMLLLRGRQWRHHLTITVWYTVIKGYYNETPGDEVSERVFSKTRKTYVHTTRMAV